MPRAESQEGQAALTVPEALDQAAVTCTGMSGTRRLPPRAHAPSAPQHKGHTVPSQSHSHLLVHSPSVLLPVSLDGQGAGWMWVWSRVCKL